MNAPEPRAVAAAAAETASRTQTVEQPRPVDADFERLLKQQAFSTRDLLGADGMLDKVLRLAEVMANGRVTIPKHLHGNVGDCAAVIGQAMRWGMDHNTVAQKTHLVNGTLGYEAQLIIAVLNSSSLLTSRLAFAWPDDWAGEKGKEDNSTAHWCEVSATLRGETVPRVLRVSMAQVGSVRNSPLWQADARLQLAYLAAKRWGRLHAPDVVMGVYTPDEIAYGRDEEPPVVTTGAPPPPPPPPGYSDADFKTNLPKWKAIVESGKKTAATLLAMLSTKAAFSDEQRKQILALQPAPESSAPPPPPPPPPPAPTVTGSGDPWLDDMEDAERRGQGGGK